ncbi:MAG: Fic family protein [Deltaproteobacteria bacterium]|nr:Fic family protein [Deltaproteobacteria bacterium]
MKKSGRYGTSHLLEDQYEPGSRRLVLKNLLGIKSKREMDRVEGREYVRAHSEVVTIYGRNHRFTAADMCKIHGIWLGPIYPWAGQYRQVNLIKGSFPFAPAREIPRLMEELEHGPLNELTPCRFGSTQDMVRALAVVHAELVLIHPFREGNGRLARLLGVLMALQAGLPTLDFGGIAGRRKREYFSAVQAALGREYRPMENVFSAVLKRTRRLNAEA